VTGISFSVKTTASRNDKQRTAALLGNRPQFSVFTELTYQPPGPWETEIS